MTRPDDAFERLEQKYAVMKSAWQAAEREIRRLKAER